MWQDEKTRKKSFIRKKEKQAVGQKYENPQKFRRISEKEITKIKSKVSLNRYFNDDLGFALQLQSHFEAAFFNGNSYF